MKRLQCLFIGR